MAKDTETYNLFEKLSKTNANISFTQLFCVSPYLRKICMKGMKADKEILNKINKISIFDDLDDLERAFVVGEIMSHGEPGENSDEEKNFYDDTRISNEREDNLAIKALIDTGLNVNVITKSFYETIRHKYAPLQVNQTSFELAGNKKITSTQTVRLKIRFNNLEIEDLFWIFDSNYNSYDLLIGRGRYRNNK
ncbi:hypothetical protein PIROE2DRAFT_64457 [Piromyces sp. E2]|nr:hypothetical protein PIROE2DRAFT_64457 [Piromyces sp. E2]|eukprot:OUM58370.1 hypothetical protein PIROE2DRAFT_64457 [Piromyces sp. E2]